jgi:hypothetical protein
LIDTLRMWMEIAAHIKTYERPSHQSVPSTTLSSDVRR